MLRDEVGMAEVEALDRLQGIKKEIANTGTYSIQAPELAFGAKVSTNDCRELRTYISAACVAMLNAKFQRLRMAWNQCVRSALHQQSSRDI